MPIGVIYRGSGRFAPIEGGVGTDCWSPDWPLTANTSDIQKWNTIMKIPKAIRERQWCYSNNLYWPRESNSESSSDGTLSSIVDNNDGTWTITCSSNDPIPGGGGSDNGIWWNGTRRSATYCGTSKYFVGVSCGGGPHTGGDCGQPYYDGSYDIVIEVGSDVTNYHRTIEPWQAERFRITDNTNNTITFQRLGNSDPDNWIASGFIDSLSDLAGCRFKCFRQYGHSWHERWPQFPNDQEQWKGNCGATGGDAGKVYVDGTGYLYEQKNIVLENPWNHPEPVYNAWTTDQWADKEVVIYDTDGVLRRIPVTSNSAQKIFFGGLTQATIDGGGYTEPAVDYTISGVYSVMEADERCWPDRDSQYLWWWYGGFQVPYYGHDPRDRYSGDNVPSYSRIVGTDNGPVYYELESLLEVDCGDMESVATKNDMMDNDNWVIDTNCCDAEANSRANTSQAPDIYKTLRGWQVAIENLVGNFVEPLEDFTGYPYSPLPAYNLAKVFYDCGINAYTTTLSTAVTVPHTPPTADETEEYFNVSSTYYGLEVAYCVRTDHREVAVGSATADASTGKISVGINNPDWAGATVYYSALWTRYRPDGEFLYLYDVDGNFYPDMSSGDVPAPIDGPAIESFDDYGCNGVGTWQKRPHSTGPCVMHPKYGYAVENAGDFVAGRYYRYVGNSWSDTTLGSARTENPLAKYDDHCYEGTHHKLMQGTLRVNRSGTVTSSTSRSVTDSSQNWWSEWFSGGELRTETGTSTAGSTTTLVTDNLRADATMEESCWWNESRFEGFTYSYEGFILEVDYEEDTGAEDPVTHDPITETVTYKFPITQTDLAWSGSKKATVHFEAQAKKYEAGNLTITSGMTYRIREPKYKLNRWKGKRVTLTYGDGTKQELGIVYNDNKTLWVDAAFSQTPDSDTVFQITEYETGGIWKYQTTEPSDEEKATLKWQKLATNKYMVQVPEGTSDRGATIKADPKANEPNKVKGYGRLANNDYITIDLFNEMYAVLNKLVNTTVGHTWNAHSEDNHQVAETAAGDYGLNPVGADTPATLFQLIVNGGTWHQGGSSTCVLEGVNALWSNCGSSCYTCCGLEANGSCDNTPTYTRPYCFAEGGDYHNNTTNPSSNGFSTVTESASIDAAYFYADMTAGSIPVVISHAGQFIAWAMIDAIDHDDGETDGDPTDIPAGQQYYKFNGNNSGLLFREWAEWDTAGVSNASFENSATSLGALTNFGITTPPSTSVTTIGTVQGFTEEGFWVNDWCFIVNWNVSGGLCYVVD